MKNCDLVHINMDDVRNAYLWRTLELVSKTSTRRLKLIIKAERTSFVK